LVPTSIQYGSGTTVSSIIRDNKQGDAINTGNPLDIQITGSGYFALNMPDGNTAYTRDGSFQIDPVTNQIVTALGYVVSPGIEIPIDHQNIIVRNDGTILVQQPNNDTPQVQGQLELALFANPTGLELKGNNIALQTDASGEAQLATPGQDNYGATRGGWLEGSNVNPIVEMTDLVEAQRAYEMNVKVTTTSWQTLEKIINA
jgi:flagellar basal-body rod protein FlgG